MLACLWTTLALGIIHIFSTWILKVRRVSRFSLIIIESPKKKIPHLINSDSRNREACNTQNLIFFVCKCPKLFVLRRRWSIAELNLHTWFTFFNWPPAWNWNRSIKEMTSEESRHFSSSSSSAGEMMVAGQSFKQLCERGKHDTHLSCAWWIGSGGWRSEFKSCESNLSLSRLSDASAKRRYGGRTV